MVAFGRYLLFSLAVFGDVVRALPKSKRQAWNFWFGDYDPAERVFNRHSFTATVSRLLVTDQISKIIKKGKVVIKITPKGLAVLSSSLDLEKFQRRTWDKKWRVIIFDVYEKDKKQRERLRAIIKNWGFGMLQESVWISPFPLEEQIREYFSQWRIRGEILVCRAEVLVGDQKDVAVRVWKLGQLNRRYRKLLGFWQDFGRRKNNKKSAFHFQQRYFDLLFSDPFLPVELLPQPWLADRLRALYAKEVLPILGR